MFTLRFAFKNIISRKSSFVIILFIAFSIAVMVIANAVFDGTGNGIEKTFSSKENVESIMRSALRRKFTSQVHIDCVREADVYNVIEEQSIEGLTILSVDLKTIQGQPVDYITFTATSLPLLSTVNFTVQE